MSVTTTVQAACIGKLTFERQKSVRGISKKFTVHRGNVQGRQTTCVLNHNPRSDGLREAAAAGLAAALIMVPIDVAYAFGPETVPLDVQDYVEVKCPEGVPKNALCVDVTAGISYTNKKPAYNSEVFGRVRYQNGESALYGDFAEASDAGKIADISDEINAKSGTITFMMKLSKGALDQGKLDFENMKTRTYPGMRADFRVVKPVSETEPGNDCEEAAFGLECPEELPF